MAKREEKIKIELEIPILTNDKGIIENAGIFKVLTIEDIFKKYNRGQILT